MPLLRVDRSLLASEHQQLRQHIPKTNRLGDLSIKWRRLGEAGLTFVDRGEFQTMTTKKMSRLALGNTLEVAQKLNQGLFAQPPHADRVIAPVVNVDFFGEGPYRSIAYVLESEQLVDERSRIITELDRQNGVNGGWREFEPHVTLATIPSANMSDHILDAFWSFAPEELTLLPTKAYAL